MSDGSGTTVWCSSVSAFRIFGKDVKLAKLGIVENVLCYFMLCVLIQVYLVVKVLSLGCRCNRDYFFAEVSRCATALFHSILFVIIRTSFPASC